MVHRRPRLIGDLVVVKHFLNVGNTVEEIEYYIKILKVNKLESGHIKDVDIEIVYQLSEYFAGKPYYSDKFTLNVNELPKNVALHLNTWIRENQANR